MSSIISCNNGSNAGLWSGFTISNNSFQTAKCGSIQSLNNTCDCVTVSGPNVVCPNGKYISSYNNTTKQATCCGLCSSDGKTKMAYEPTSCSVTFKNKGVNDISCPPGTLLKEVNVNSNNTKMTCCSPKLQQETSQETIKHSSQEASHLHQEFGHNLHQEMNKNLHQEMNNNVSQELAYKTPIQEENVYKLQPTQAETAAQAEINKKCKKYGLDSCTADTINATEAKCNTYGMRYYDSTANKYQNTDSYLKCHNDNFDKLDNFCKQNNLQTCNFYTSRQQPLNNISQIQTDVGTLDKINGIYESKFNNGNDFNILDGLQGNIPVIAILVLLCFLITIGSIYLVLKI